MKIPRSHVGGNWFQAKEGSGVELRDPTTEEVIASVSSSGLNMGEAVQHARVKGGAALMELSHASRG